MNKESIEFRDDVDKVIKFVFVFLFQENSDGFFNIIDSELIVGYSQPDFCS